MDIKYSNCITCICEFNEIGTPIRIRYICMGEPQKDVFFNIKQMTDVAEDDLRLGKLHFSTYDEQIKYFKIRSGGSLEESRPSIRDLHGREIMNYYPYRYGGEYGDVRHKDSDYVYFDIKNMIMYPNYMGWASEYYNGDFGRNLYLGGSYEDQVIRQTILRLDGRSKFSDYYCCDTPLVKLPMGKYINFDLRFIKLSERKSCFPEIWKQVLIDEWGLTEEDILDKVLNTVRGNAELLPEFREYKNKAILRRRERKKLEAEKKRELELKAKKEAEFHEYIEKIKYQKYILVEFAPTKSKNMKSVKLRYASIFETKIKKELNRLKQVENSEFKIVRLQDDCVYCRIKYKDYDMEDNFPNDKYISLYNIVKFNIKIKEVVNPIYIPEIKEFATDLVVSIITKNEEIRSSDNIQKVETDKSINLHIGNILVKNNDTQYCYYNDIIDEREVADIMRAFVDARMYGLPRANFKKFRRR